MLGHLWLSSVLSVFRLSLMKYFPILLVFGVCTYMCFKLGLVYTEAAFSKLCDVI